MARSSTTMKKGEKRTKEIAVKGGKQPSTWHRRYTDPEKMRQKVDEYVKETKPADMTITGLLLHLDMGWAAHRDYASGKYGDEFAEILNRARLYVENSYEIELKGGKPVGSIFALKNLNREEWNDKQEVQHTHTVGVVQLPERTMKELDDPFKDAIEVEAIEEDE